MRRREFIAGLAGAAAMPLAARAQQAAMPTIGFLGQSTRSAETEWTAAFVQRLRELGWIEGRTVAIEYRWAEGRDERYAEIAAEFVRLKVDVIVTSGTQRPRGKAGDIGDPDRVRGGGDPVGSGLVASLARPGGNVTGLSSPDSRSWLASGLNSCARSSPVCAVWRSWPMSAIASPCWRWARFRRRPARSASKSSRWKSGERRISRPLSRRSRAARMHFMSVSDPLASSPTGFASTPWRSARDCRRCTVIREYVETGGLMSYGPNFPDMWRRAAEYVDKILRGAKPADIPVEQPTKFDLVDQSEDRQGARPHRAAGAACARRRGDRIG